MTKPPLIWANVILFSTTLIATLLLIPWYQLTHGFETVILILAILGLFFCGLSITAGYHRLWSHRTYQAHWSVRLFFAIGGAFALQNSALHWSSNHRTHHKFVDDNERDPYSAKRGFWYSHIGWLLRHYDIETYDDYNNVRDLQKDPIVMWQHRHYLVLAILTNVGFTLTIGWLTDSMLASIIAVGCARLVCSHHFTFFINSWAHMWGSQPYTDKNTAKDNWLLAIFTHGEGYHNFHHIFESDYRNGIKWYHYDPTKWLINLLAWCGLATKLRITPPQKIEQAKLAMILQRSQQRLGHHPDVAELKLKLQTEYEKLITRLNQFYGLKKKLFENHKSLLLKEYDKMTLKSQLKELNFIIKQQKKAWLKLANA